MGIQKCICLHISFNQNLSWIENYEVILAGLWSRMVHQSKPCDQSCDSIFEYSPIHPGDVSNGDTELYQNSQKIFADNMFGENWLLESHDWVHKLLRGVAQIAIKHKNKKKFKLKI